MSKTSLKILLLTKYNKRGASSRLRTLQYIPYLESNAFFITVSNFFDDKYLEEYQSNSKRSVIRIFKSYIKRFFVFLTIFRYDLIWIEKEIFPYFPALFERILKLVGKAYIVDYDDAIFHNYDLSKKYLIKKFLDRKIYRVMKNAECVIVGNKYLAKYAESTRSLIRIIPTVVDSSIYIPKKKFLNKSPVIGWIGSRSTQKYLNNIYDPLKSICNLFDVRLLLIGATSEIASKFSDLKVDLVQWNEAEEISLIRNMDIGIMPLSDGPWEKGKCGYKLIQYMACAVPVIASPVGINIEIITKNNCGLLADSNEEWKNAFKRLLNNPEKCGELGNAGRVAVEQIYSLKTQAPIIKKIFFDVANTKYVK
ncbi:glycosyltransferase family 4 protein [Candidatus Pelagibacter sp.]|nr:glycosyltransferase family 4 protein [Candidatus Pelagibacter sp.]